MEQIKFNNFGVMIDCSRNAVRNVKSLKKFIDYLSKMGYNMVQLYTEDTFEVNNEAYFGYLRGRYSKEELKELDKYAASKNIQLVPCIQTLAHLNQIFRWDEYKPINDCNDILLTEEERTMQLLENMFATCRECFSSNLINIGMDEAQMVGLGQFLRKHGFQNRFDTILNHLVKVSALAEKYNFKPMMWSDMFFKFANNTAKYYTDKITDFPKEVLDKVPENISLVYWDYYQTNEKIYDVMMQSHKKFNNEIWFAGGAWTWAGITPHNRFSMLAMKAGLKMAIKNQIENVFITLWGDDGGECSVFAMLPSLYYASCLAKGITNMSQIKKGFKELFNIDFDKFMYLDLPDTVGSNVDEVIAPGKIVLYSDPFLGAFDGQVTTEMKKDYLSFSRKLAPLQKNEEFGYLFATQKALCDVCYLKSDLGIKTREYYKQNKIEDLKILIKDYDLITKKIEVFYKNFKTLWFTDNKPHGFDIQDLRIGGIIQRLKSCKQRLIQFVNGEIDIIEELEEEILPINLHDYRNRIYYKIASPNVIEYR